MSIKNSVDSVWNMPKQVYKTVLSGSIFFENDGAEIVRTNYWQSQAPRMGFIRISFNAGTFRMLLPYTLEWVVGKICPDKEIIISYGPWLRSKGMEILFNHDSKMSFAVKVQANHLFPLPFNLDSIQHGELSKSNIALWTRKGKEIELPCSFRTLSQISL